MIDPDSAKDVLSELSNEWKTLTMGSPIPGLYPQNGTEQVRIKGKTIEEEETIRTEYTIVISDEGKVVGTYHVRAEESRDVLEELYNSDISFREK